MVTALRRKSAEQSATNIAAAGQAELRRVTTAQQRGEASSSAQGGANDGDNDNRKA